MNENEINALVVAALDDVAPGKSAKLGDTGLDVKIRDLSIDSVASMEMVGFIEDKLGTTFPDEDLAAVNKLSDLADLIRSAKS